MGKQKKRKKKNVRTAKNSDKWELYELSVQEPEAECDLIDQVWSELRDRQCRSIREDFCGTAVNCVEWVKRHKTNTAIGVDIEPDVLARARKRVSGLLKAKQQARVTLLEDDVQKVETAAVDSVLAFNFSYFIFKTRETQKRYFERVHQALADDGLFLLDAYGGSEAFLEMEEPRDVDGFEYVWDQAFYSPVTGDVVNHIHFRFPDGSKMKKAFTYEWRLWTLPELQEMLLESGFKKVHIYWEGTGEDGEGNGEWSITKHGDADEGWIAYLVAMK
jgi:SAM-dependent methyltransferase